MNTSDEKLCLKWNEFQENTISAFGTLKEDREFADVTLACEDGQQVEAHKVILASSSPFFLNLLKRNKHPHPLIYMRGLKSEDLIAMVDFLYYGEANVYQENLDSFLAVAEELQLKGLMGSNTDTQPEEISSQTIPKKTTNKLEKQRVHPKKGAQLSDIESSVDKVDDMPPIDGTVAVSDYTVASNLQDLDGQIKSMMKVSDEMDEYNNGIAKICKVCGKEGKHGNIMKHIEANHITGVSHSCDICGTTTRSRPALVMHKRRNHTSD